MNLISHQLLSLCIDTTYQLFVTSQAEWISFAKVLCQGTFYEAGTCIEKKVCIVCNSFTTLLETAYEVLFGSCVSTTQET